MKRVAMCMTASVRSTPEGSYTPALADLVQRLSAYVDLTVFTVMPPSGDTEPYRCGDADVSIVPVRYDDSLMLRALRFTRAFLTLHRSHPFDLVHGFWGTPTGLAAVISGRRAGVRSIVTLQGGEAASLPSIRYGNMSRLSTKMLTLWVCRRATALTALTQFQADAMKLHGLKREVDIIPYGAPDPFFCADTRREASTPLKLLHVADLNRVKDQATLLKAFRIISSRIDSRLTIAGHDQLDGEIERLAEELGVRDKVAFLGHVHHERLPSLYSSADFLLHTSLYEAQGVVISEAFAAGSVVCGTRVGLIADLNGTCALGVPPGDHQALAESVVALAENPRRYREIQHAAKSWAERHNAAWTAGEFLKLYQKVLNF